ncbi:DUF7511 domain-containing protein [Natronobacterium gregoryi]|uniref:DUF7511 domain-containing protein n=1 Tax=Natronobacterium gregoryi (strain ATCC 43098 / DSM 3393 / CCM 3738 / CIP 104747 / IAM 13177 / JCM 8860 / NBRC 102187 / NCIMB 2189 / SP2) TaxID=797304 RepID=A0A2J4JAB8_NATGS|nr:hypothetical protein [Natronobacterium gregoryi]PLK18324.1 hypothetical protein CYV19_18190 [Natronobacterium gregoryi SP2]
MTSHDADGEPDADGRSTATGPKAGGDDPATLEVSPCYQAYLERHDDRVDSCTIYSAVTAESAREQWIRAWGEAFVSRENAR